MKTKLLRKLRREAESLIDSKLFRFRTEWGIVTALSYAHDYAWAFEWMFRKRLDYYEDHAKIVNVVTRLAWNHHNREFWQRKLRTGGKE